jgi:heparan sulfate N-deacetylase/N-sulfotransferase NDST2
MRFNGDRIAVDHSFLEVLNANSTSNAKLRNLKSRCIKPGFYAQHLERWLSSFPVQQIVIVDGQRLASDPASVMLPLQHQLQLRPSIDYRSRLKFSRSKGFFCVTSGRARGKMNCLGKSKGRVYDPIDKESHDLLVKLYSTHNQALAKLLNKIGQQLPNWLRESTLTASSFASNEKPK